MTDFYRKWQGKLLCDAGGEVSKEYKAFQVSLTKEMGKLAEGIGAKVVSVTKGHYGTSFFVERDGRYAYVRHDSGMERDGDGGVLVSLDRFLIRTAEDAKDYTGGSNGFCGWRDLQGNVDRLLR